ncbi:transcriptional regulator [uncultured Microbacterium sp.]|uniref:transcriptional regulator n=1 Tax=uncultured Microbacterium sp. TaxID=191216 RepID=UPI0025E0E227|nr:transcriptional regulator [uncultured Microbacterium sp.]
MAEPHPRTRLDDNFAGAIRFSMMAALREGVEMDFGTLAQVLQANDSAVSKAIAALGAAGYVVVRKGQVGARPRTWVRASARGAAAFEAHVQALRDIVAGDGSDL